MTATAQLLTASGRLVDLATPSPAAVDIRDIAHALARLCRWGGHTRVPMYSVAQHSILVSETVPPEHALVGLLHDATEAYLGDVIGPLKKLMPAYLDLERGWALAIGERFGLGAQLADLPPAVKEADARALATERRDLTAGKVPPGRESAEPHSFTLQWLWTTNAQDGFMARFDLLTGGGR